MKEERKERVVPVILFPRGNYESAQKVAQEPVDKYELVIVEDDPEFKRFFDEVLRKLTKSVAEVIKKTAHASWQTALNLTNETRQRFDKVFDEFLTDVDDEKKKKIHQTIHFAGMVSAIIGMSPIPFSDAALLVPLQLVMMGRLHKIFGQSWSESLGSNVVKEVVVVSFGRSIVGNVLKFIPAVGTVVGGAINATFALTITETLGWTTVKLLNEGVDIFNDVMSFQGQFKHLLKTLQKRKK